MIEKIQRTLEERIAEKVIWNTTTPDYIKKLCIQRSKEIAEHIDKLSKEEISPEHDFEDDECCGSYDDFGNN